MAKDLSDVLQNSFLPPGTIWCETIVISQPHAWLRLPPPNQHIWIKQADGYVIVSIDKGEK